MEECYCLSYRLVCDRYVGTEYESYAEPYCSIADCCDAQPVGNKASCIPDDDEIDEIIDTIEETIAPKDDLSSITTTDMPAETEDDEEEIPADNTPEDVGSDMPAQTEGGDEISSDNTAEVGEEDVVEPTSIESNEEEEEPNASVNSGSIISGGVALVALAFVVGLFE